MHTYLVAALRVIKGQGPWGTLWAGDFTLGLAQLAMHVPESCGRSHAQWLGWLRQNPAKALCLGGTPLHDLVSRSTSKYMMARTDPSSATLSG